MVSNQVTSLEDVLDIISKVNMTPVAGGTDLMVRFKSKTKTEAKVDSPLMIGNLSELKGIFKNSQTLTIGACTTISDIIVSDKIPTVFKKALLQIGSPGIRNQATLGGNICNASPAGDSLPLLYLFKAKMVLVSKKQERVIPIEEFIIGPGKTQLSKNEILKSIVIENENLSENHHYIFEKMGNRKADSISKASFGLRVLIRDNVIADIDAAFGAMGPKVTLLNNDIKEMFLGESFPIKTINKKQLKEKLFSILTPIDDQRSTAEYRKTVAFNLLNFHLTIDV